MEELRRVFREGQQKKIENQEREIFLLRERNNTLEKENEQLRAAQDVNANQKQKSGSIHSEKVLKGERKRKRGASDANKENEDETKTDEKEKTKKKNKKEDKKEKTE